MNWLKNPQLRVKAAFVLLVISIIGYPISAITMTSLDILSTADVRKEQAS